MTRFVAILLCLCLSAAPSCRAAELVIEKSNGDKIRLDVEIAQSEAERAKGLMFRNALPNNSGMLFVFPDLRTPAFWMKNTWIPLDMVFIGGDSKIVSIYEMAMPQDLTPISPDMPVRAVLELNGGLAGRWGIGAGDKIYTNFLSK